MSDPHVQHAQSLLRSMEEQVAARLTAAQQHAPNSKPILRLYRTLHDLFAQSEVYALDGDDARCYMMLSTTMRYYLSIIKKHPAFTDRIVAADKAKAQALCEKIMTRMERMRAELMQQYEQESREAERDAKREAQQREEMAREQAEREQAAALAATFAPTSPSPTPPAVAVAALTALPPLQPPILPLATVPADLPGSAAVAVDAPPADVAMPATTAEEAAASVMTDGGFTPSLNPFALASAAPSSSQPADASLDAFANMEAARILTTPKPAEPVASEADQLSSIEPDAPMMDSALPTTTAETEASAPPPPPATSPYATAGAAVAGMAAASTVASAASTGASLVSGAAAGVAASAGAGLSAVSSLASSSSSAAPRPSHSAATWIAPSAAPTASAPPPSSASGAAVSGYPALQQKAAASGTGTWPPPPPPLPAASAPPPVAAAASSSSSAAASKPRQRTVPPMPTTLRPIHLPSNVLGDFYAFAKANTDANIETCGILCGHLDEDDVSAGGFRITHVLIPNQTATADTCVTTNEEDLISLQMQFDLLTLGWIHTHPSQTCFLSSVDLHTHYTYQLMLPEAIAIVLAPRFQPNQGVFHCTLPGMKALTGCSRSGFHKHEEKFALYSLAPHVCWENGPERKAKFIDLRTKRAKQSQQPPPPPPQQPQQQQWRPPVQQPHTHPHPHPHSHQPMHPQQMQPQRPMGFAPHAQPMQGYPPQQPLPHQHRPGQPPHVHR